MRIVHDFALGILAAGFLATTIPAARAGEWCGFVDKDHSKVTCGYSSLAVCMPDPSFAGWQRPADG